MNKFEWDNPLHLQPRPTTVKQVSVSWDAYEATKYAHCICILTEWDEFKNLEYKKIFDIMHKPAFLFDGKNIMNLEMLRKIGFIVYSICKQLDSWLKDMHEFSKLTMIIFVILRGVGVRFIEFVDF